MYFSIYLHLHINYPIPSQFVCILVFIYIYTLIIQNPHNCALIISTGREHEGSCSCAVEMRADAQDPFDDQAAADGVDPDA